MSDAKHSIEVNIPEGDLIYGYIAAFKVLASDGTYYWATRMVDLNDMEALGMAQDMANSFGSDLQRGKKVLPDDLSE